MTTKAETSFLNKERKAGANVNDPEYLAYVRTQHAEVEKMARAPASAAIGRKFPVHARMLQNHTAAQGVLDLLAGNVEGWAKLHDAQQVEYWQAVVLEKAFERETKPDRRRLGLSVNSFADGLVALHLGAASTAEAIVKRLVADSHESPSEAWSASTGALPFMARLYELLTSSKQDWNWKKFLPLGGYERLLDDACVGAAYVSALEWGCTEHIAQTRDTKKVLLPFDVGVSVAMPVELICWLRYRRSIGLEHGTHGHPLLETALATLDPPPATNYRTCRRTWRMPE